MPNQTSDVTRQVTLTGTKPIQFDRYPGDNSTRLEPRDKFYFDEDGNITLPCINIFSFLCAMNSESATQRVMKKKWKQTAKAALAYTSIEPLEIKFAQGKKQSITVETADFKIVTQVARLKGGIPNPKQRPMLALPWSLSFKLTLFENDEINEATLKMIFEKGGRAIGLGTFRTVYGKFKVTQWE